MNLNEAESRVLAGILPLQTSRMEKAALRTITEDNFSQPHFRTIWRIIEKYYEEHLAIVPLWAFKTALENQGVATAQVVSLSEMYTVLSSASIPGHEFEAASTS